MAAQRFGISRCFFRAGSVSCAKLATERDFWFPIQTCRYLSCGLEHVPSEFLVEPLARELVQFVVCRLLLGVDRLRWGHPDFLCHRLRLREILAVVALQHLSALFYLVVLAFLLGSCPILTSAISPGIACFKKDSSALLPLLFCAGKPIKASTLVSAGNG
jgi:hypothetical protein